MTQGTNTTTQANDANFLRRGQQLVPLHLHHRHHATRLSLIDVGTESVDLRGRYRVFLRYRKTTSTDDINIQLVWGDISGLPVRSPTTRSPCRTPPASAWPTWGRFSIPGGDDPVYGPDGVEMSVSDAFVTGGAGGTHRRRRQPRLRLPAARPGG